MKREEREPLLPTRKLAQELAERIYHSANCPRSWEALRERVDQETRYRLNPKQLKKLTRRVANADVED